MTPQNITTKSSYPKNVIFSENPKSIEIQNFEPPKMTQAYVCMKISEYPPWGFGQTHLSLWCLLMQYVWYILKNWNTSYLSKRTQTNSADPDQTASKEAVWSWSSLLAILTRIWLIQALITNI